MPKKIREVAYNALSLLVVSGVITEQEFKEATSNHESEYDDLFNLIEEKHKEFYAKANYDNQK